MTFQKKILIATLVLILVAVVAILAYAGNMFYEQAFLLRQPSRDPDPQEDPEEETEAAVQEDPFNTNQAWLEAQRQETFEITSDDGLKLVGTYIYAHVPAGRTAILVHGYNSDRMDMLGFARIFVEEMGYNVFMPDLRGHGDSEGEIVGFGWTDRLDMKLWIRRVLQQHSPDEQIVLFGTSMGGATVMMTAGEDLPDNVKAIVSDCGYTTAKDILAWQLKQQYNLPAFPLVDITSLVARHRAGFFLGDASAVAQLRKTTLPVLLIHGEADTFVPYSMMQTLYDAAAGPKERYSVPGAGHGAAYRTNPGTYQAVLQNYLAKYIQQ